MASLDILTKSGFKLKLITDNDISELYALY